MSKKKSKKAAADLADASTAPKLAKRRLNKRSTIKSGRTIGERRERLETASERLAAHKKNKHRQNLRVIITVIGFIIVGAAGVFFLVNFFKQREVNEIETTPTVVVKNYNPTIEIVDESSTGGITTRMSEYIGQAESDFRDLGYTPLKAVIPAGSIREVDFYLDGHNGFIKTTIDRGTGVSIEDADRMLRYLAGIDVHEFTYIDVRIDGKAYWK
ncbi:MAG: hypothetical protein Q4A36_03140 [Candidatus Saccharibacteria bacterium]|nr:hypothetical protein [Candidatus Saccharibacteria bacterium]